MDEPLEKTVSPIIPLEIIAYLLAWIPIKNPLELRLISKYLDPIILSLIFQKNDAFSQKVQEQYIRYHCYKNNTFCSMSSSTLQSIVRARPIDLFAHSMVYRQENKIFAISDQQVQFLVDKLEHRPTFALALKIVNAFEWIFSRPQIERINDSIQSSIKKSFKNANAIFSDIERLCLVRDRLSQPQLMQIVESSMDLLASSELKISELMHEQFEESVEEKLSLFIQKLNRDNTLIFLKNLKKSIHLDPAILIGKVTFLKYYVLKARKDEISEIIEYLLDCLNILPKNYHHAIFDIIHLYAAHLDSPHLSVFLQSLRSYTKYRANKQKDLCVRSLSLFIEYLPVDNKDDLRLIESSLEHFNIEMIGKLMEKLNKEQQKAISKLLFQKYMEAFIKNPEILKICRPYLRNSDLQPILKNIRKCFRNLKMEPYPHAIIEELTICARRIKDKDELKKIIHGLKQYLYLQTWPERQNNILSAFIALEPVIKNPETRNDILDYTLPILKRELQFSQFGKAGQLHMAYDPENFRKMYQETVEENIITHIKGKAWSFIMSSLQKNFDDLTPEIKLWVLPGLKECMMNSRLGSYTLSLALDVAFLFVDELKGEERDSLVSHMRHCLIDRLHEENTEVLPQILKWVFSMEIPKNQKDLFLNQALKEHPGNSISILIGILMQVFDGFMSVFDRMNNDFVARKQQIKSGFNLTNVKINRDIHLLKDNARNIFFHTCQKLENPQDRAVLWREVNTRTLFARALKKHVDKAPSDWEMSILK